MHLYDSGGGEAEDIYLIAKAHWEDMALSCRTCSSVAGVVSSTPFADAAARHREPGAEDVLADQTALRRRPPFRRGAHW